MADEADLAGDRQEFLDSLPRPEYQPLPFTGRCYNCDETLSKDLRFCDKYCRDDWEKRCSSR